MNGLLIIGYSLIFSFDQIFFLSKQFFKIVSDIFDKSFIIQLLNENKPFCSSAFSMLDLSSSVRSSKFSISSEDFNQHLELIQKSEFPMIYFIFPLQTNEVCRLVSSYGSV
jgi:hypothetical protein